MRWKTNRTLLAALIVSLSGTAAVAAPHASLAWGSASAAQTSDRHVVPLVSQSEHVRPPVLLAQMGDPRVTQLEEQVRQLNGLVEELNFQVLQMQDQLRRMQEDNEFRFEQIEEQRSDATGAGGEETRRAQVPEPGQDQQQAAVDDGIEEIIETPDGILNRPPETAGDSTSPRLGEPPRTFGRIVFDSQGNVVGGQPGDPPRVDGPGLPGVNTGPANPDGTTVAALPSGGDPEALYRDSYQFILSGDYSTAAQGFRQHVENFPDDPRTADAQFWLGEALLAQGDNREAAQIFLAANRDHPDAPKAADSLLKLGVALAAMEQRDVACATLAEVSRRYPDASSSILDRARQEQANASC